VEVSYLSGILTVTGEFQAQSSTTVATALIGNTYKGVFIIIRLLILVYKIIFIALMSVGAYLVP
ncbi:MAG: hypothetical protein TQ35_0009845, partial [Candidatus Aramenus sulfurataquae]|jgi:hypothetical protein|nr:hypothetical protein [Candidatus Aramenus sulfurataquae]